MSYFINSLNGNKRRLQGKLFVEPFHCIFKAEEKFYLDSDMEKLGISDQFPQGTICPPWFFIMSAGTKVKGALN